MNKYFKNLKNISIIISNERKASEKELIVFSLPKLIMYFTAYSLLVFSLGLVVLNLTSLGSILVNKSDFSQTEYQEKLNELNKKIIFLSKEIEKLKTTNERLRYAIILGDSTLSQKPKDSNEVKKQNPLNKAEGSVFLVLRDYLFNLFFREAGDLSFIRPINGFISREFNPEDGHYGVDFSTKIGSPIYAAASGYVLFSDYTVDDGYMIIIVHSNDYISIYKHCFSLLKKKRDKVIQGELIALSGNTGKKSYGPHLHFEIWNAGNPLNPLKLFIN